MAGTPADLTVYKDATIAHDHSYYGRGCKNGWGGDGSGGSITPCADSDAGGRYVVTSDGETQKNGTYMNFQAASSGSGATITTQNTVAPDSFCPLGWQLPYSGTDGDYYDKSKSWRYLLQAYSITSGSGSSGQDTIKMTSYPFSNVFNGYTYWVNGRIYEQSHFTILWSSTNSSADGVYWFVMHPTDGIRKVEGTQKTRGNGIRCHFKVSILILKHNWYILKS